MHRRAQRSPRAPALSIPLAIAGANARGREDFRGVAARDMCARRIGDAQCPYCRNSAGTYRLCRNTFSGPSLLIVPEAAEIS